MIHYNLHCARGHAFDGWFKDSTAFDMQVARGLLECPDCGERSVVRALMAPAIGKARGAATLIERPAESTAPPLPDQVRAVLQRIRAEIEQTSDYVGPAFADEVRRIHHGECEQRSIYGESTQSEAEALADEGIAVTRIPWVKPADG